MTRSPERLACFILARNLGDIVVQSGFVKRLVSSGYAERYLIWTRPQLAFLFDDLQCSTVICSQFPVGTSKQFDGREALRFVAAARQIRRLKPSVSLDFIGDMRERLLARLIGAQRHLHIGWTSEHPYSRLIRNHFGPGQPLITVPTHVRSVYAAYELFVKALNAPQMQSQERTAGPARDTAWRLGRLRVGIHPFASIPCKHWPAQNWHILTRELLSHGASVTAFGAPQERQALQSMFDSFGESVRFFTGSLQEFAREVSNLDILVGLDSFSVHMAHRQGISSVTVNAGTPPELWAVPSGITLGGSGGCAHYPCFNIPKCLARPYEFACTKSTSPRQVMDVIRTLGSQRPPP